MLTNILVPTDGSKLSAKAVNVAIELVKLFNAGLVALDLYPRYPGSPYGTFEAARDVLKQAPERQAKADAEQLFADIRQQTEAEGLPFDSALVESNAVWKRIIAGARRRNATSYAWPRTVAAGRERSCSVARRKKVLMDSTLPVLVVR